MSMKGQVWERKDSTTGQQDRKMSLVLKYIADHYVGHPGNPEFSIMVHVIKLGLL